MKRSHKWITGALAVVAMAVSCLAAAEPAPDFTLKDLNGKPVTLSALKGKVVFLDFWASWCPPCRNSIPAVEKLHEDFAGKNLVILGINVENDPAATKQFVARMGMKYTVLVADQKTIRAYKIGGIPAFFIIGPDGTIAKKYVGFAPGTESAWEKEITQLLATAQPSPKTNPSSGMKKTPNK